MATGAYRWRKTVVLMSIVAVLGVMYLYKNHQATIGDSAEPAPPQKIPRLVDLGSDTCEACQQMMPILLQLQKEYAGRVDIQIIDVYRDRKEAAKYKIRVIPTQILFDAAGNESGRNEGPISKDDLIKAFERVGVKR